MKLLKFSATWCGPCKAMSEILKNFEEIPVEEIDVDENSELTISYNIRNIPTLVVVDSDGKELGRKTGVVQAADLTEYIRGL